MPVDLSKVRANLNTLGYFRFAPLGDRMLLSNEAGDFLFLSQDDFRAFVEGTVFPEHARYAELREKGFLKGDLATEHLIEKLRARSTHLQRGPCLHTVQITTKTPTAKGKTMGAKVIGATVEMILKTTSPFVRVRLTGGEPLSAFSAVKQFVETLKTQNDGSSKPKNVTVELETSMEGLTPDRMGFLLDHEVLLHTWLDGPQELHDANCRTLGYGAPHGKVTAAIQKVHNDLKNRGLPLEHYHVPVHARATHAAAHHAKAIADAMLSLGVPAFTLAPPDPYAGPEGHLADAGDAAMGASAYLALMEDVLDHLLALHAEGKTLRETEITALLTKLLTDADPLHPVVRNPGGQGIGELAYGVDGTVYTCSGALALAGHGDDTFALGKTTRTAYKDVVKHDTVKSLLMASTLDFLPGWLDDPLLPFAGVSPVESYGLHDGHLFAPLPLADNARRTHGLLQLLLARLASEDPATNRAFEDWVQKEQATRETFFG